MHVAERQCELLLTVAVFFFVLFVFYYLEGEGVNIASNETRIISRLLSKLVRHGAINKDTNTMHLSALVSQKNSINDIVQFLSMSPCK